MQSSIDELLTRHMKIGGIIKAANKVANPFKAVELAKEAAAESHELLGDMLNLMASQSQK